MGGLVWLLVLIVLGGGALGLVYGLRRGRAQPLGPTVPPPSADDIRRELADLLGSMVGQVPIDLITKYESIHQRILDMLPRMGQLGRGSQDLYILHRISSDYLPGAIESYLALARSGAGERMLPDGRTPHQLLMEQLDLIETRLKAIADALDKNDLDRLLVHGRFLEARFGSTSGGLGVGP